jgi:signal transduction histidine kinase
VPPNVEKARGAVERIIRDTNRASEVIHDIRTSVKKTPPHQEELDLNDLIYRTLTLANGEMTREQVELQTELAVGLPKVLGDRVQLQQVLLNLIVNAIEAMSSISGGRLLTMRSAMRDPESITVSVSDSGAGIDPQKAEHLFDAFFTTKPQGMGMGLSICRTIVSAHGGHLSNVANAGTGATFEFTLPAHVVKSENVGIATA